MLPSLPAACDTVAATMQAPEGVGAAPGTEVGPDGLPGPKWQMLRAARTAKSCSVGSIGDVGAVEAFRFTFAPVVRRARDTLGREAA